MKNLMAMLTFVLLAAVPVLAQGTGGGPRAAAQPFQILTGQSIADAVAALKSENKTQDLVSGEKIGTRVFVQHEKNVSTNAAEVHEGTDDVFIILEGSAILLIGGKLDSPTLAQPGEWRGKSITGGKEVKLAKGDIAFIPRGTPHQRTTANQEITLMIVKSFTAAAK
jgi:mannose-6-phosphate isomerase-like protein (cupin superfamily)